MTEIKQNLVDSSVRNLFVILFVLSLYDASFHGRDYFPSLKGFKNMLVKKGEICRFKRLF